jgi:hypothetical protein
LLLLLLYLDLEDLISPESLIPNSTQLPT